MRDWVILLAMILAVVSVINYWPDNSSNSNRDAVTSETRNTRSVSAASEFVSLRVMVFNDTEKNPIPPKSEIWFRGHGSWWLHKEVASGAAAKDLGKRRVGELDHLFLYPDGRDSKEIKIPVIMTKDMNPEGSVRDSLTIAISDDSIEIGGFPLKAATGETRQILDRR